MELINQVLEEPQVLWTRTFFEHLQNRLPLDQKEVVLNWFHQMTNVSNQTLSLIICRE